MWVKSMTEITIVTAFFDIGREKWQGFQRSSNKYVEYFEFWARLKNKLVVYTDKATAEQVLKIRDDFNLKERTKIIVIDDVYALDEEVYHQIERVLSNKIAVDFRTRPNSPESCNARYNYTTYLKPYFVADAVKNGYASGMTAWVDFGYNHGGEVLTNSSEFDFLWCYDFSSKIHLFTSEDVDDMPIFEVVRTMRAYIQGSIMIAPAELWGEFANLYKEAMLDLTHCGFADDDQTLSLMAYKKKPELFELHEVEISFDALKKFGNENLTIRSLVPLYKKYKRTAKKYLKDKQYQKAFTWYFKYAKEKILGGQRYDK
jgi:protein YibB